MLEEVQARGRHSNGTPIGSWLHGSEVLNIALGEERLSIGVDEIIGERVWTTK